MTQHIVLLNTAHASLDDRVFYHQAKSLSKNGCQVSIISTAEDMETVKDTVNICSGDFNSLPRKEKQGKIVEKLRQLQPNIIICDTPIAVLSAKKYAKKHKTKVIYDITEWCPSANHLKHFQGVKNWIHFVILLFFNLYAGLLTDGFIFGERSKAKPFRFFYFWKPYILLPYFTDLKYVEPKPPRKISQSIRLFYGGSIRPQRGLPNVIESIQKAAQAKPKTLFELHLLCTISNESDKKYFEELTKNLPSNIEIYKKSLLSFPKFCNYIDDMDLFFDLREISFESNRSLPIKLFYYLACGRPVIYSNLKSISGFFADISFGHLVNPSDTDEIANKIIHYIDNPNSYVEHCQNALKLSKEQYNWKTIEGGFVGFVKMLNS